MSLFQGNVLYFLNDYNMFHIQPLNHEKCVLLVKQRYIQQFILMLLFFQLQRHFYQVLGS